MLRPPETLQHSHCTASIRLLDSEQATICTGLALGRPQCISGLLL